MVPSCEVTLERIPLNMSHPVAGHNDLPGQREPCGASGRMAAPMFSRVDNRRQALWAALQEGLCFLSAIAESESVAP
jgi:hypothetical protein